jgi:hypothetical protein
MHVDKRTIHLLGHAWPHKAAGACIPRSSVGAWLKNAVDMWEVLIVSNYKNDIK